PVQHIGPQRYFGTWTVAYAVSLSADGKKEFGKFKACIYAQRFGEYEKFFVKRIELGLYTAAYRRRKQVGPAGNVFMLYTHSNTANQRVGSCCGGPTVCIDVVYVGG